MDTCGSHRVRLNTLLLGAAILCLGAALRFAGLESAPPRLFGDEAFYAIDAAGTLSSGHWLPYYSDPLGNGREGMFIHIMTVMFALFGQSIASIRSTSAFIGVLTLPVAWLLTTELFYNHPGRRRIAMLALFLLAVSYWHLTFSRIAFHGILVPLFQGLSLWLFLLALRRKSTLIMAVAGGVAGLGAYTYLAYWAYLPLFVFLAVQAIRRRQAQPSFFLIFPLTAFIATIPLACFIFEHPDIFFYRMQTISLSNLKLPPGHDSTIHRFIFTAFALLLNSVKMLLMPFLSGDANWRHNYAALPELSLLAMGGVGCAFYFRRHYPEAESGPAPLLPLLLLWTGLAALPAILSSPSGMPHALRGIGMILPLHLLAAAGLSAAWTAARSRWPSRKPLLKAVAIALLAGNALSTPVTYFLLWNPSPATWEAFPPYCPSGAVERYPFLKTDCGVDRGRGVD